MKILFICSVFVGMTSCHTINTTDWSTGQNLFMDKFMGEMK